MRLIRCVIRIERIIATKISNVDAHQNNACQSVESVEVLLRGRRLLLRCDHDPRRFEPVAVDAQKRPPKWHWSLPLQVKRESRSLGSARKIDPDVRGPAGIDRKLRRNAAR